MKKVIFAALAAITLASPAAAWRLETLPDGYQQVDLVQLQAQFYEQYPKTQVFGFVSKSNKGVKVNREGKIEYRTPGMLRTTGGWVKEYTPERMCFTHDLGRKWWTCVSMYRKGDDYMCRTEIVGRDSNYYWKCGPKAYPRRKMR